MKKQGTDNIQPKPNASHDKDQLRILHTYYRCQHTKPTRKHLFSKPTLKRDKSLNRLQEYADSQRKEKGAVEKCAQKLGSLPSEGEGFGRIITFGDLILSVEPSYIMILLKVRGECLP